jgi:hypothetical protein
MRTEREQLAGIAIGLLLSALPASIYGVTSLAAASAPPANPGKTASGIEVKSTAIKLMVTGGGKPIQNAEVQVKRGTQSTLYRTAKDGTVLITVAVDEPIKVRVVATGWKTWFEELDTKKADHKAVLEK